MKHLKAFGIPLRPSDQERARRRPPAYGQRRLSDRLVSNARELRVVELMKQLRAEGLSYWKIAARLNALKTPTKTEKGEWSAKQVHQILKRLSQNGR